MEPKPSAALTICLESKMRAVLGDWFYLSVLLVVAAVLEVRVLWVAVPAATLLGVVSTRVRRARQIWVGDDEIGYSDSLAQTAFLRPESVVFDSVTSLIKAIAS